MVSISQKKVNDVLSKVTYLQIIGSFATNVDFRQVKEIVVSTYDFFKHSEKHEIEERFEVINSSISKMTAVFLNEFPIKKSLNEIANEFNDLCKSEKEIYSYGFDFGWLSKRVDLSKLNFYSDTPFHFKIGLAAHKGNGSIEEDFLLKDSYNTLVKAEFYQMLLLEYGSKIKSQEEANHNKQFSQAQYKQITDIKFEVAALSRLTIISFYAFVEGFVNSVGYSYLLWYNESLDKNEKELLVGQKNGRYLNLKSKIEKYQTIIRNDKSIKLRVTDKTQIPSEFKYFFEYYEELRNSAMHYSPIKEKIWLRPNDWYDRAKEFSALAMKVSLEFWKSCYPESNGPEYLGRLDNNLHLNKARKRFEKIKKLEKELEE